MNHVGSYSGGRTRANLIVAMLLGENPTAPHEYAQLMGATSGRYP
jgi:hypothetical protein